MIPAFEAIKAINRQRGEALVVPTMTPDRYWTQVTERPELDLPIFGGMGKASSVALGLALAQPEKKVLCLDGDGALLMNLGSLVTIAGEQPPNLVHFVFEDGVYFTTGGQPIPGAGKFDLAGIARSSGMRESLTFDDLEDFVSDLPGILERQGPIFVALKVVNPEDAPPGYVGSSKDAAKRVMETLREQ